MNYTVNSIENIIKYPFKHSSSDNNKINNIKHSLQILNEPLTQSLTQVQFQIWCTTFTSLNPYTYSTNLAPLLLPLSNLLISCSKSSQNGDKLALVYQFFDLKLHLYLSGLVYTDISVEPLQILEIHEKPDVIGDDFYGLQIEILKFFSILLEGLKNEEILGYLYSNKFLPNLTHYPPFINTLKQENNSSYEEAIAYWITLLKNCSLKLKLKPELVELFINRSGNSPLEQMPIYFHPIQYFNNPELMIRISVKVLCLNLFQINNQNLIDLILNSEGEEFDFINNWTKYNLETAEEYLSSITNSNETKLDPETLWFSLTDNLEFLNDILLTSTPKISDKFLKSNFEQIILPILQNSWITKEGTKISLDELEYFKLVNLILKSIKHQNMLNLIVFTLFYNELKNNLEENAKVSETYFIDSKDDKLKELLNLTELEIEKSENLSPIYANSPKLITYVASQTSTESTMPLLIQVINLLNLLAATYSKDINLKLLLKINLLPSRLTKDLLVVKLGINNNKEFNAYMNSNVKDKPWLIGLLEVNNDNEAKKNDDNTSSSSTCYWANLVFYNPELFNTLLNWLQNPLLLAYPKLSKIIKNLIIDLTYFPGIKYCLTQSDGLNLLDLFNSNKSALAKNIPNLILKPLIWMSYFNYFKELEDNSTLTQNLLNSTSFPVESYLTGYSKLVDEHLELFKLINLHANLYQLLNWNLRIAIQKLGKLTIPLQSTKNPPTNSEIVHLKKSTSEEHFSVGIRIPQNYPTIENLVLIPSKLPRLNFYKLQTTKFLKTQTLKLEYSFNLLELEFLPYLPENSSDKTLLVKNLTNGGGFNLIFLDFKECEYCRTLMFQKQLEVIEKVEKKLIRMMRLDLSTKLEDNEKDEEEDFNGAEDGEEEDIYEEFMQ